MSRFPHLAGILLGIDEALGPKFVFEKCKNQLATKMVVAAIPSFYLKYFESEEIQLDDASVQGAYLIDIKTNSIVFIVIYDKHSHSYSGRVFVFASNGPNHYDKKTGRKFATTQMFTTNRKKNIELDLLKQYIRVPWMKKKCDYCNKKYKKLNPLKLCSKCRCVYYCSRDCQKRAWKSHHRIYCLNQPL